MTGSRAAMVAGSFDPVTYGHLDVIVRARRLFDRVVVAVLVNPGKSPMLALDERVAILREVVGADDGIEVHAFAGLLAEAARLHDVQVVVRGLRSVTDYEHEWPMAHMNATLLPGLETVLLPASPQWAHVSARLVREIHGLGGAIEDFVPPAVLAHLRRRA